MFSRFNFQVFVGDHVLPWVLSHGVQIVIVAIIAVIAVRVSRILTEKIIRRAIRSNKYESKKAEEQREDTLITVFNYALTIAIYLVALLTILSEIGVDIAPLIAGAGVIGLAVGFGGQYLIRDLLAGFFIILENQYRVGDVVEINKTSGSVQDVTLRMTVLRDLDGVVHNIPNGEIKMSSNMTKEFARVNLDVGIAYASDIEKVIKVVNKVGEDLSRDKDWKDRIIEPPQFLRVDGFGDSSVIIKILGQTQPLEQWAVTGELRKRLKIAFDKSKIEIPFPHRVMHMVKD